MTSKSLLSWIFVSLLLTHFHHRLKMIYNVQRVFNLVWIIFCANIIEMTLVKNNMRKALSQYSHISSPAQLLPLLVGTLSFIRTLWKIFQQHGKTIANTLRDDAEKAENEAPKFLHRVRLVFEITIRKIISPLSVSSDIAGSTVHLERSHSNTPHRFHPLHHRYLVAWLPWLSVFKFWKHYCAVAETLPLHADAPHREDIKLDASVHEEPTSI